MNDCRRLLSLVAGFCVLAASALADDATDELLEDITGPSEDKIAALATEARVGNADSRAEAIWKLGQHENGIAALAAMLPDAPPDVLPHVVVALGWQGPKAKVALAPLTGCLTNDSFFTRSAAVWALGRIGDKSSGPRLEPFLKSDHELLCFLAEEALARCSGRDGGDADPSDRLGR